MTEHEALPEGEEAPPPGTGPMSMVRWVLLGLAAVAAALSVGSALLDRRSTTSSAPVEVERYHCPMHPQIISKTPDQCPICGMKLVLIPKAEILAPDAGLPGMAPVDISAERIQALGVRIEEVRDETLPVTMKLLGRITADPSKITRVHVRVQGYVEKLHVAEQGARVKSGQPLVAVYSDELLRLQAELLQAKRWAGDTAEPIRQRLRLLGVTNQEIENIEKEEKTQHGLVFRSPISGFVTAIHVTNGGRIDPGQALFEISDLSRVWVLADLFERDIAAIQEGMEAQLSLDAYPGKTFAGKVEYIYPTLNEQTRTLLVRTAFSNTEGKLKPGMFGSVHISRPAASGITVSAESVIDTGDHRYVYVETSPGHFVPREIVTGARAGERMQVVSGLQPGERVASSGNFFIDAESRLRSVRSP